MNENGSGDQEAAEEWVMKMLDEPQIHKAGLERWIGGRPDRRALFDDLMRDVEDASAAAATMQRTGKRHAISRNWAAALAAGLVGLLVLSVYEIWLSPSELDISVSSLPTNATIFVTRVGEVRTIALQDGSSVTLDTDSLLSVDFSAQRRALDLRRGRARFIVSHDLRRPFIVRAGNGEVLATGTIFDVLIDGAVKVNLIEGSVKVTAPIRAGEKTAPRHVQLKRGQQTTYNTSLELIVKPSEPSARQWIDGVRSLDDVAIKDLIAEANRYNETKIELAKPILGERRIFGQLNVRDVEGVASASAAYLDLEIDRAHPGRLILRPKN